MKRQIIGVDTFSTESIRNCEKYVFSMQQRLDKAVADNNNKSIRETFDLLTKRSSAVKELATWRITNRNVGKYTAGVDGIALPRGLIREKQNIFRQELMDEIDISKTPDTIRRVFIPKPNGTKRPLGIPTIRDRIVQEILRIGLEPIAEYHFHGQSYGFRPKRSCQDAMIHLHIKLSRVKSPTYVVEGDIKGCFDNINHDHIIETLNDWIVPKWSLEIIMKILKSGIYHNGQIYDSDTGTPQGGVISPLLANVALTTLDNYCDEIGTRRRSHKVVNPIVRYADDFILVSQSEPRAIELKEKVAEHLKITTGLTLSEEKTKIIHITKGFNFLGFNFRKYEIQKKGGIVEHALRIQPQKEKADELLTNCREIIKNSKTVKQEDLIRVLSPKLRGWGLYYRFVNLARQQYRIDRLLWYNLYLWAVRRHPHKTKRWIINKYFTKVPNKRIWRFGDKSINFYLPVLGKIPRKRFIKIDNNFRVYDSSTKALEYWEKREYLNAYDQIESVRQQKLFRKQKGKCFHCKDKVVDTEIQNGLIHIHHVIPKSEGGTNNYSNLRLVHSECHKDIHRKILYRSNN